MEWIFIWEKMNLDPLPHPVWKKSIPNGSKCERWNNKVFRGKYKRKYDLGIGKMFLDRTQKVVTIKKMFNWTLLKLRPSVHQRHYYEWRATTEPRQNISNISYLENIKKF